MKKKMEKNDWEKLRAVESEKRVEGPIGRVGRSGEEREDEEEGTCQALEMGVVVLLVCPPFTVILLYT